MALENEEELTAAINNLSRMLGGLGLEAEKTKKQTQTLGQTFGKAASNMAGFGAGLANGQTNLGQLNKVVDTAADAMSKMAASIPLAGAAITALAEGTKFLINQVEATAKSFQDLSKVGAVAADGMEGVRRQFQASGLSLQGFTKVIGENSMAMARFRGLTSDGAEDFSKVVGQLTQGSDDALRKLGLSAEDIGAGAAAFVTQQTRLGRSQAMTNEQLAKGTTEYVKELDLLSKVTGQSRESIQKQQDAALSETRFRAKYDDLIANGQEGAAKALMGFQTTVNSIAPSTGKALRDLSTGVINSKEAQDLMTSTNGRALEIINRVNSGQITQAQATQELQAAMKGNIETMRKQAMYNGQYGDTYLDYAQQSDLVNASLGENGKLVKKANENQTTQIEKTDDLTVATVGAQKNLEKMAQEINKLGFTLLPQAAEATKWFTDTMTAGVKKLTKQLGLTDEAAAAQDDANWKNMSIGEKLESSLARGLEKGVGLVSSSAQSGLAKARISNESDYMAGKAGAVPITGSSPSALAQKIGMVESGGRNINNASGPGGRATSSATGIYQFTKGTFEGLAKSAQPGSALYGKSFDDYKSDTNLQHSAMEALMARNKAQLGRAGIEGTDANMYLAHFLGAGGATKALSAGDSASLSSVVSPDQLAANPHLQKMRTVADLKQWAAAKMGGPGSSYTPMAASGPDAPATSPVQPAMASTSGSSGEVQLSQLSKLDELIYVGKAQVSAIGKLIQMQS